MSRVASVEQAFDMIYNTQKSDLVISEYGRHIQRLAQYAKTIEDKKERQATAEAIVDLMYQMNPQGKKTEEFLQKLWKHLLRISDYELDVDPIEGVEKTKPEEKFKKADIPYPKETTKFRHYGRYVKQMIDKAVAIEDESKKAEYVRLIGSYMKIAYSSWNADVQQTKDVSIKEDLEILSNNQLTIDDDTSFDILKLKQPANTNHHRNNSRRNNNHRKRKRYKN